MPPLGHLLSHTRSLTYTHHTYIHHIYTHTHTHVISTPRTVQTPHKSSEVLDEPHGRYALALSPLTPVATLTICHSFSHWILIFSAHLQNQHTHTHIQIVTLSHTICHSQTGKQYTLTETKYTCVFPFSLEMHRGVCRG